MAPSKQWMQLFDDRSNETYLSGVQKFLNYAFQKTGELYEIRCPCIRCCNTTLGTRETVEQHLKVHGIIQNYTFWYHHGEVLGEPLSECEYGDDNEVDHEYESEDEIQEMLSDLYPNHGGHTTNIGCDDLPVEEPNVEAKKFYSLLGDFEKPLYQNSKISKLSSLIKLLHIKSMGRWSKDLLALSRGPTSYVLRYNGYIVNGYRFHVEDHDRNLRTQNCGVVVVGENDNQSENIDYYGVLTDVLELQFMGRRVIMFKCNWFDVHDKSKGVKTDDYDIVSVNWGRFLKTNEPFVLADQASQVFYANDNSNKGWRVARKIQPRDSYEIVQKMDDDIVDLENSTQKRRKRTTEV